MLKIDTRPILDRVYEYLMQQVRTNGDKPDQLATELRGLVEQIPIQ